MYIWVCKSIFAWNSAQYFEAERNKYKKKQTNKKNPWRMKRFTKQACGEMKLPPFFPLIIFILLCFNVLSTVPRENRLADFLYVYICMYICTVPSLGLVPRATLFDSASDRGRIGLWERQFAWQPRWPLGCANPCCRSVISRQLGRNGF